MSSPEGKRPDINWKTVGSVAGEIVAPTIVAEWSRRRRGSKYSITPPESNATTLIEGGGIALGVGEMLADHPPAVGITVYVASKAVEVALILGQVIHEMRNRPPTPNQ